jgi:PAS domain-containing protein
MVSEEAFVAHVELSLSEAHSPGEMRLADWPAIDRWAMAVDGANEPCLVVDSLAVVAAVSGPACAMFGLRHPQAAIGRSLYSDLIPLLDFTGAGALLGEEELQRIPPVLALSSGRLARGLMRFRTTADVITMDAVSTPLRDGGTVVGSLTFFSVV